MARVKEYALVGFAADDNGIATTQALTINVPLTLEAVAAALSPPREIEIDASASIAAIIFTVVGTDRWGNTIRETITGVTTTAVRSQKVYASVTSITPDTTSAETVIVGWAARTVSPWVVCGRRAGLEVLPTCLVSLLPTVGAADGIVEVTYDSNQSPAKASYPHIFETAENKGEALPVDETLAITPLTPVEAQGVMCRVVLTSGAATEAKARFAQPGP